MLTTKRADAFGRGLLTVTVIYFGVHLLLAALR